MTKRSDIKSISVVMPNKAKYKGYGELNIVYENNLILEQLAFFVFNDNVVKVTYTKPYTVKYFGLVVEWMVNHQLADVSFSFAKVAYAHRR